MKQFERYIRLGIFDVICHQLEERRQVLSSKMNILVCSCNEHFGLFRQSISIVVESLPKVDCCKSTILGSTAHKNRFV